MRHKTTIIPNTANTINPMLIGAPVTEKRTAIYSTVYGKAFFYQVYFIINHKS